MTMPTSAASPVSLRERVKASPAQSIVDSYFAPAIAAGVRFEFEPEMRIHKAHALMLADRGIVAAGDAAALLGVLDELHAAGPSILAVDYKEEDLYSYVERFIVRRLGAETGGRLHTGRSRNDLHTTSWRMALRTRLVDLLDGVLRLRRTLTELAGAHVETVMPGYTHTQHAQPISLGYYLLAAADLAARDYRRLDAALACVDRSPLGSAALSSTGFAIDREMTARLLGFPDLVENAYDGVAIRDDLQEAVAALAVMMTGVSRTATDLQTWNTMEFGFVELDDSYASVSSIMPQKKNPQGLEHAKAVAAMAIGTLNTVLAAAKNTALADVNDAVSSPNAPALETIERATGALSVFEGTLRTLTVHPGVMRRSAEVGFGTATELADLIVRETGLSFRMAHNIVGRVVREAIEAGRTAVTITGADLDAAAEALFGRRLGLDDLKLREALDPMENLRIRTVTGGPAPVRMAEMLARRRAGLSADAVALDGVRKRIADADATLAAAVRQAMAAAAPTSLQHVGSDHGAS